MVEEMKKKRYGLALIGCVVTAAMFISNASGTIPSDHIWNIINGDTIVQNDTSLNVCLGKNTSTSYRLEVNGSSLFDDQTYHYGDINIFQKSLNFMHDNAHDDFHISNINGFMYLLGYKNIFITTNNNLFLHSNNYLNITSKNIKVYNNSITLKTDVNVTGELSGCRELLQYSNIDGFNNRGNLNSIPYIDGGKYDYIMMRNGSVTGLSLSFESSQNTIEHGNLSIGIHTRSMDYFYLFDCDLKGIIYFTLPRYFDTFLAGDTITIDFTQIDGDYTYADIIGLLEITIDS